MKISSREIAEALDKGGEAAYNELSELVRCIKQIQEDWRDANFVEVRVFSDEGNISSQLRAAFPKFHIWWEGDPGCCGENIVLVPGEMWSDSVKAELQKFDTWAGHHEEKECEYKLLDGVDLPYDLKQEVERIKKEAASRGKTLAEVRIPRSSMNNWPLCRFKHEISKYFVETYRVVREWDEPLVVHDRRKYHADFVNQYKQVIEI